MLCTFCDHELVPRRLFCPHCGEVTPEGRAVMAPPGEGKQVSSLPVGIPVRVPASAAVVDVPVRRGTVALAAGAPTSPAAVISLVFGLVSWFAIPLLGAAVAVVSGHIARHEIRLAAGRVGGTSLATVGLVLGYAQFALITVAVVAATALIALAVSFAN